MDELKWRAAELGLGLLGGLLTWIGVLIGNLIKARVENEYLRGTLSRLNDTVWTVVKDVQQTLVNGIKIANADGRITPEETAKIRAAALASLKSYLGVAGLAAIGKVLGLDPAAVDNFLLSKVEAAVHDLRNDGRLFASAAAAVPVGPPQ